MTVQQLIKKSDKISIQKPIHPWVGYELCQFDDMAGIEFIESTYHDPNEEGEEWIKESLVNVFDATVPQWKRQKGTKYIIKWDLAEDEYGEYYPVVESVTKF